MQKPSWRLEQQTKLGLNWGLLEEKMKTKHPPLTTLLVPLAACCSRIFFVLGVVPLGMLMMYFPSISAVTRRRLTGIVGFLSSASHKPGGMKEERMENSHSNKT